MPLLHSGQEEALAKARGVTGEAARQLLLSKSPLAGSTADAAMKLRGALEDVGHVPTELTGLHGGIRDYLDTMPQRAADWGINLHEMVDPAEASYFPRYASEVKRTGRTAQIVSTADPSKLARKPFLKGIQGGTPVLAQMAQDVAAARGAPGVIDRLADPHVAALAQRGTDPRSIEQFLAGKYGAAISPTYVAQGPSSRTATQIAFKSRPKALAKYLSAADLSGLEAGIYGNHPLVDLGRRAANFEQAQNVGENIIRAFADPELLAEAHRTAMTADRVPLANVLKSLKFQPQRALEKIAELRGLPQDVATIHALGHSPVPADLAGDLSRYVESFKGPKAVSDVLKVVDSLQNAFKVGVTSPFPSFHARNLLSGQVENWFRGMFSPRSVNEARQLAGGGAPDLRDIPIVQAELARRGLPNTAENSADMLRLLAHQHDVVPAGAGEYASVAGQGGRQSGQLQALARQFPGGLGGSEPTGPRDAFQALLGRGGATWNPRQAQIRGVGDAAESTLAPLAAGERLGQHIETLNRLSPFIHQLRAGVDPAQAARMVRAAQVDYSARAATPFERHVMKRIFPFYTFSRNVIPRTLTDLVERPGGRLAQTIHGITAARSPGEVVPEYVSEGAGVRIPEGMPLIGTGPGGAPRYLTGLGLMFEDAANVLGAKSPQDLALTIGSRLRPEAKFPIELATGKSLFQKGPRGPVDVEAQDPLLGRLLANVAGQSQPIETPRLLEHILGNLPTSRLLATARAATNPNMSAGGRLANLLSGLKLTDVPENRRDAILRELLTDRMKQAGARTFEETYFPRERQATMSPAELAAAQRYSSMMAMLAARARQRAEERRALAGR